MYIIFYIGGYCYAYVLLINLLGHLFVNLFIYNQLKWFHSTEISRKIMMCILFGRVILN